MVTSPKLAVSCNFWQHKVVGDGGASEIGQVTAVWRGPNILVGVSDTRF